MPKVDPELIGWWDTVSFQMAPIRTLALIGGIPGKVCFSESGDLLSGPSYGKGVRFSCAVAQPYSELNVWICGHERFPTLCIYSIAENTLKITVAGCPLGVDSRTIKRPSAMRMNGKRNWVLATLIRCEPPRKKSVGGIRAKSALTKAATVFDDGLTAFLSGKAGAKTKPTAGCRFARWRSVRGRFGRAILISQMQRMAA
jgi:hypothetical protein